VQLRRHRISLLWSRQLGDAKDLAVCIVRLHIQIPIHLPLSCCCISWVFYIICTSLSMINLSLSVLWQWMANLFCTSVQNCAPATLSAPSLYYRLPFRLGAISDKGSWDNLTTAPCRNAGCAMCFYLLKWKSSASTRLSCHTNLLRAPPRILAWDEHVH